MSAGRLDYQTRLKAEFKELNTVIANGNLAAFQKEMQQHPDWACLTPLATTEETILHAAISNDKPQIIKFLLAHASTKDSASYAKAIAEVVKFTFNLSEAFKGNNEAAGNIIKLLLEILSETKDEEQQKQLLIALSKHHESFGDTESVQMAQTRLQHLKQANDAIQLCMDKMEEKFSDQGAYYEAKDYTPRCVVENMRIYQLPRLQAVAANLGVETAQNVLENKARNDRQNVIFLFQIINCHFALNSKFSTDDFKHFCRHILEKHALFYQGLCCLYGLNTTVNFYKAIKLFNQFINAPDKRNDLVESAQVFKMLASISLILEESDPKKISQYVEEIMHSLQELPLAKTASIENDVFRSLFYLIRVADKKQIMLQEIVLERYKNSLYKCSNGEDLNSHIFSNILTLPNIKTDRNLWKKLVNDLKKIGLEQANQINFIIQKLEILDQQAVAPAFQYDIKLALAECYAASSNAVSLGKSITYYESMQKLAHSEAKIEDAKLESVYKRYADAVKSTDKQAALAAYDKAVKLGNFSVLKDIVDLDEKRLPTVISFFETEFRKANDKTILNLMKNFLSFAGNFNLFESDVRKMIIAVFEKHGRTLIDLTKEELIASGLSPALIAALTEILVQSARNPDKKMYWIQAGQAFCSDNRMIAQQRVFEYIEIFEGKSIADAINNGVHNFLNFNDQSIELLIVHFKNFLLSTLSSKKFVASDFDALRANNPKLERLQQSLLPLMKEHLFMMLDTMDKNSCGYKQALLLLNNIICNLADMNSSHLHNKESNEHDLIKINELLLENKQTKPIEEGIINNLNLLIKNSQIESIQRRAVQAILTVRPLYFRNQTDLEVLAVGARANNPEAIYQLGKRYDSHKHLVDTALYLKAKFILLTFNNPNYKNAMNRAESFVKTIAKQHSDASDTAKYYQQLIAQFRASKKVDSSVDIDSAMLNGIALLEAQSVKQHVINGMQKAMSVDSQWIKNKQTPVIEEVKPVVKEAKMEKPAPQYVMPPAFNPQVNSEPAQEVTFMYPTFAVACAPERPSIDMSDKSDIGNYAPIVSAGPRFVPDENKQEATVAVDKPVVTDEMLTELWNKLNEKPISPLRKNSLMQPAPKQKEEPKNIEMQQVMVLS